MIRYLIELARPFALVAIILLVVGVVTWHLDSKVVQVGYGHKPLDFAGPEIPCTKCQNPFAKHVRGYSYRCDNCGMEFTAKMRNDAPGYIYEPDLRSIPSQ